MFHFLSKNAKYSSRCQTKAQIRQLNPELGLIERFPAAHLHSIHELSDETSRLNSVSIVGFQPNH
jgi:hypothetical protein